MNSLERDRMWVTNAELMILKSKCPSDERLKLSKLINPTQSTPEGGLGPAMQLYRD